MKSFKNPAGTETQVGAGYNMQYQVFGVSETPKEGLLVELSGEFGNEGSHRFTGWKTKNGNLQIENGGAVAFTENGMFVLVAVRNRQ